MRFAWCESRRSVWESSSPKFRDTWPSCSPCDLVSDHREGTMGFVYRIPSQSRESWQNEVTGLQLMAALWQILPFQAVPPPSGKRPSIESPATRLSRNRLHFSSLNGVHFVFENLVSKVFGRMGRPGATGGPLGLPDVEFCYGSRRLAGTAGTLAHLLKISTAVHGRWSARNARPDRRRILS